MGAAAVTARAVGRAALVAALASAIVAAYLNRNALEIAQLDRWVRDAGAWGPAVYMGAYALATVLSLPGALLTLAGGALFGPVWGAFYSLTGATIGATAAFAIARYAASDWVGRRAGGWTRSLIDGVETEGWRFVAFVRLVPFLPFNLLNYALGLTRIRLAHYVLASYVFMLPGALAYTYLGYAGREAMAGADHLLEKGLAALALLAAVAFLPRFVRRLRGGSAGLAGETFGAAELKARLDERQEILVVDVRTVADYAGGHVPGAANIPVEALPQRISELKAWRDRPVAVVCRTNRRSGEAARQLREQGFRNVLLVNDGMLAWQQAGFPVDKPRRV
jgi:uncharacterized membrane protein YdjX (TVP38/TMEM64 family)/rhodanese-related sulfurtransferase